MTQARSNAVTRRREPGIWGEIRRLFWAVYHCLGWRVVTYLTGALVLLLGTSGWLYLQLHRQHLVSLLEEHAIGMAETILTSTQSSMMANDETHLRQIIENLGRHENVIALRIVNAAGEVRYATNADDVGTRGDISEFPCQGCHQESPVRSPVSLRDGLQMSKPTGGEPRLGLGVPILNTPECSDVACHVHPANQRVLGMLDLELSTTEVTRAISTARHQMVLLSVVTIIAISGLCGWLAWRFTHRPIHALLHGTRRLAKGDFSHRVDSFKSTEIGELATSFNIMTEKLQRAHQELEDWGRTLEQKVSEKTRELELTRDQMIFAEKMASLGKLAAIVAHEINNPLAGVLVCTKLVRRRLPGVVEKLPEGENGRLEEIGQTLATMEQAVARCGDLVKNLLLFSRRREASMAPEDLNAILQRAVRLIQHQADLQEVNVVFQFENLPEVTCDAAQIEQASLAVVMNAIEAMPDGGTLTIGTKLDLSKDEVRILIKDTGTGVPDALRTKVFEPFFSTKKEGTGTGLGLSVMYGIIQQHSGRVAFQSKPGEGTTFVIDLPVHPKDEATLSNPPATLETQSHGTSSG